MHIEVRPRKIKTGRSNPKTLRSEKSNTPKLENEDPLRLFSVKNKKANFQKLHSFSPSIPRGSLSTESGFFSFLGNCFVQIFEQIGF